MVLFLVWDRMTLISTLFPTDLNFSFLPFIQYISFISGALAYINFIFILSCAHLDSLERFLADVSSWIPVGDSPVYKQVRKT